MDVFFKLLIIWSFLSFMTLIFIGSTMNTYRGLKDVILNLNKTGVFFILLLCVPLLCLAVPFVLISFFSLGIGEELRDLTIWLRHKFFKDYSKLNK